MRVLLGVHSSSLREWCHGHNLWLTTSHVMDADRMFSALTRDFLSFASCFGVAEVFVFHCSKRNVLHGRGLQVVLIPFSHCTFLGYFYIFFLTWIWDCPPLLLNTAALKHLRHFTQLTDTQANWRQVALRPLFEPCGTFESFAQVDLKFTWPVSDCDQLLSPDEVFHINPNTKNQL